MKNVMPYRYISYRTMVFTLVFLPVGWAVVALSYFGFIGENPQTAYPGLVAIWFSAAAVLSTMFVIRPRSHRLYTLAGAASATALAARAVSIISAAFMLGGQNQYWIIAAQIVVTLILVILYWWFWQVPVRFWVQGCKIIGKKR